jgi:hypothetical protein
MAINFSRSYMRITLDGIADKHGASCGYLQLDGYGLVPFSFLDRLERIFWNVPIRYGSVIAPRQLIGDDTWDSFDDNEREVTGSCLMFLIEIGAVRVELPTAQKQ